MTSTVKNVPPRSDSFGSITFTATSNKIQATKLGSTGEVLRNTIATSAAFERAFPAASQPWEEERYGGESSDEERYFDDFPSKTNKIHASIIQSSNADNPVHYARYGLVSAILDAYNRHHNLVLRPDDVWQAILTQFSFYVNANAEDLRDCFVDFKGKKTLVIEMPGTLFSADFASFANCMVDEQITINIKDPSVTEWLLPNFSTTKTSDRVAASVTIMSTLQAYFEYVLSLCCGIPQVTLEGTPDDWRVLRRKIDRLHTDDLKDKDPVMTKWQSLLAEVLDQLVASSEGKPDLTFWDTVCSHHGGGSGPSYLSGWVTVFACFTSRGNWQGDVPRNWPGDEHVIEYSAVFKRYRRITKSGTTPKWPRIDTERLPIGAVSVPVLVDDNGTQYDTQMLAGQFAYEGVGDEQDTVRPRTDWCIAYDGKVKAEPRNYKAGEVRPTEGPSKAELEAAVEKLEMDLESSMSFFSPRNYKAGEVRPTESPSKAELEAAAGKLETDLESSQLFKKKGKSRSRTQKLMKSLKAMVRYKDV